MHGSTPTSRFAAGGNDECNAHATASQRPPRAPSPRERCQNPPRGARGGPGWGASARHFCQRRGIEPSLVAGDASDDREQPRPGIGAPLSEGRRPGVERPRPRLRRASRRRDVPPATGAARRDPHLVGAVVALQPDIAIAGRLSVDLERDDAMANPLRILDDDMVSRAVAVDDLERGPIAGYAGLLPGWRRRRGPSTNSSPMRYIHPAAPVYQVQPPRPPYCLHTRRQRRRAGATASIEHSRFSREPSQIPSSNDAAARACRRNDGFAARARSRHAPKLARHPRGTGGTPTRRSPLGAPTSVSHPLADARARDESGRTASGTTNSATTAAAAPATPAFEDQLTTASATSAKGNRLRRRLSALSK